jgi:hypothetical protein
MLEKPQSKIIRIPMGIRETYSEPIQGLNLTIFL